MAWNPTLYRIFVHDFQPMIFGQKKKSPKIHGSINQINVHRSVIVENYSNIKAYNVIQSLVLIFLQNNEKEVLELSKELALFKVVVK